MSEEKAPEVGTGDCYGKTVDLGGDGFLNWIERDQ